MLQQGLVDSSSRNASISDDSSSSLRQENEEYSEPYAGKDAQEAEHPSPAEFVGYDTPDNWAQAWC